MEKQEASSHLAAGRYYGRTATCEPYGPGKKGKMRFTEEEAQKQVARLNVREDKNHDVEAYPCYWCSPDHGANGEYNWHVGRIMSEAERAVFLEVGDTILEMEEVILNVAEPIFGIELGPTALRVHNRKQCEGEYCCIHNPSDHHMRAFPLNWRADRRIMERICPHGVGHIDPDDAAFRERRDGDNYDEGVHGCDGCCSKEHYYSLGAEMGDNRR